MKNVKLFLIAMTFIPGWAGIVPANALPPCGLNASALLCDRSTIPQKPEVRKRIDGWPTQYQYICPESYPAMKGRCTMMSFGSGASANVSRYVCAVARGNYLLNNFIPEARVNDALACQAAEKGDTKKMYEKAAKAYDVILNKQGGQAAYQYMEYRSGFGFFDFLIERREI
jgi:hypothetical protein